MHIRNRLSELVAKRKPIVMAAGFFDGVHRGHCRTLDQALAHARSIGAQAWILTFDEHPLALLDPRAAPPLLTTNSQRLRLFATMGFDGCLMLPFTRSFAQLEPARFTDDLLRQVPSLRCLFAGSNWRFGRNGRGTAAWLARRMHAAGRRLAVVRPVAARGKRISSSWIRASVAAGRLREAADLLGRPFSLRGKVAAGRGEGRRMGFPTANLALGSVALPPAGVYESEVSLCPDRSCARKRVGLLNLGRRPTFGSASAAPAALEAEVHLPGFRGDLYGREIEVFILRKMRDERQFATREALTEQIRRDVLQVVRP